MRAEIFDGAMGDLSRQEIEALLSAYDFAGVKHLMDVGGGRGELLQKVLRQNALSQTLHQPLQFTQQSETFMADPAPRFGFVAFAETWDGRLAMLGLMIGLGSLVDGYAAGRTQFLPFCI